MDQKGVLIDLRLEYSNRLGIFVARELSVREDLNVNIETAILSIVRRSYIRAENKQCRRQERSR